LGHERIRKPTDIYLMPSGGGRLKGPAAKMLQKGHLIKYAQIN
jgi:hypothetical protein